MRFLPILALIVLLSCGSKKETPEGLLLQYGDRMLTLSDVNSMIPVGISPADSAALFQAIVDCRIKDEVLSDFAEKRLLDTQAIERRVKDYRNHLIVLEYLSHRREQQPQKIDEQRVLDYYDLHHNELKLEVPLLKGVFVKSDAELSGNQKIKELLSKDDPDGYDTFESEWLDKVLEYNYFRDKWIDWETVTGLIPYRFGDPDEFLKENSVFEIEYGDFYYFLKVFDYLPAGSEQPFEFARQWIANLLTQGDHAEYEQRLVNDLVKQSIKDKKLEAVAYDPLQHKMKE